MPTNNHQQPIGPALGDWVAPEFPPAVTLHGRYVTLEPMDHSYVDQLFAVFEQAADALWTYMPFGPFADSAALSEAFTKMLTYPDWRPYVIVVDGTPLGFCSYLRIDARGGVIEIGSIAFSPALQQTTAATETIYLLLKNAFALGYRRVEWKCDDLNAPSRKSALRFGFHYEGTFRKAAHYKGRSRDTAWFAIIDDDWPRLDEAFRSWLSPANFDDSGQQRNALEAAKVARSIS